MSVLYKALQKAAKENEQRQPAAPTAGFDPERLAGSGVIRAGSSRGKWRIASLAFLLIALCALGGGYYFTTIAPMSEPLPVPARRVVVAQAPSSASPSSAAPSSAAPSSATPSAASPPTTVPAPLTPPPAPATVSPPSAAPSSATPSPAAPSSAAPPNAAATPSQIAPSAPAPQAVAQAVPVVEEPAPAKAEKTAAQKSAVAPRVPGKQLAMREPMPNIPTDSPTRMLDPPINIHRGQIDLEGVGSAVRVRTVSQAARDFVGSAYNALIRGQYDTALGFYNEALKQEPRSVLALLGRGTTLQKLGRKDEARVSYELALKADPENLEALTNITALEAERAPGDAMTRLMDMENQYPRFSPIKAEIGMIYARMDNLNAAVDYLHRAIAITPDATLYQYNLALILDRLGRHEEAIGAYSVVLASMSAGRSLPELSEADIQRRVAYLRGR